MIPACWYEASCALADDLFSLPRDVRYERVSKMVIGSA